MLTAHFVKNEALDISLPEAKTATTRDNEDSIEIVLDNSGHILIKNKYVAVTELDKVLKQLLQGRQNKQVVLRGDKTAELGLTVKVMDAACKAGATSLGIVTPKH